MNAFSLLYFLLATILLVVASPLLILLSFKEKYKLAIPKRFFLIDNPSFKKRAIWFHVCSFGEVISLKPLLQRLDSEINLSVTTATGYIQAKKLKADVRFLPFESLLPIWINRQKVLVVSEAELWYMLFFVAKLRGAKTILINARISDNSYASYRRFSFLYRRIFSYVDMVFAQSEKDRVRLLELGAKEVFVSGNIKAYGEIKKSKTFNKPSVEVVTLASTHSGEERMIMEQLAYHDRKIIVVPRHPERFDEVALFLETLSKKRDCSFHRFSEQEDFESDIIMIDKMGELINIYAISDVVLLGGSFVENVGGHNPLEPATFGCKILSGKHIFNQISLFPLVENIEIVSVEEIALRLKSAKPCSVKAKVDIEPIVEAINDVG